MQIRAGIAQSQEDSTSLKRRTRDSPRPCRERSRCPVRVSLHRAILDGTLRSQYSSASMMVSTRLVTDGSAGSGEWLVSAWS